jgi:hypothetical protein
MINDTGGLIETGKIHVSGWKSSIGAAPAGRWFLSLGWATRRTSSISSRPSLRGDITSTGLPDADSARRPLKVNLSPSPSSRAHLANCGVLDHPARARWKPSPEAEGSHVVSDLIPVFRALRMSLLERPGANATERGGYANDRRIGPG